MIKREYDLGSYFYKQVRITELDILPFHGDNINQAVEIYESVLAHAPFAKFAAELKYRLGRLYIWQNKIDEALRQFRSITREHSGCREEKYAYFELANALIQLAEHGDGDGSYGRQAEETLRIIVNKYPDDPEIDWAREQLKVASTYAAERLYKLGAFYHSRDNDQTAARYLHELLARYPETEPATDAEELLAEIDDTYTQPVPDPEHVVRFKVRELTDEPEEVMIPPQASGGKWLLPIEDLKLNQHEITYKPKKKNDEKAQD